MTDVPFSHTSVLFDACMDALHLRDGYTYVDCTTGAGGHSFGIAARMGKNSRLLCFDQDRDAIAAARTRLSPFAHQVTFIEENFSELGAVLEEYHIENLGGVLADLGCSSPQFDDPQRGFSYMNDARLDMRMCRDTTVDAYEIVNTYPEEELRRILYQYGEERFAPRIAAAICAQREKEPIVTTGQLADLIKASMPAAARAEGHHPAKRTFQAIRIEVNRELDVIEPMIRAAAQRLVSGGRIAVISFHSLEDRIVKQTYHALAQGCTCPRDFPVCVCAKKPQLELLTKKPILPGETELQENPRSRSAKLRVAQKI